MSRVVLRERVDCLSGIAALLAADLAGLDRRLERQAEAACLLLAAVEALDRKVAGVLVKLDHRDG